jgi:ABC-type enterochelin transport system permease subunit
MNEITALRAAIVLTVLCGMVPWIGLIVFMVRQGAKGKQKRKPKAD